MLRDHSRGLGIAALYFADYTGNPVGEILAARSEMEHEAADLVNKRVGEVVVA
jgi:hypothetical protein